jgi:hypothetical protein
MVPSCRLPCLPSAGYSLLTFLPVTRHGASATELGAVLAKDGLPAPRAGLVSRRPKTESGGPGLTTCQKVDLLAPNGR